jgi:GTP diphosphokinase / guanosine-3',5'-bis(diphosphate) 3'-diphosphatase
MDDDGLALVVRAIEFAAQKHRLQRRKDVDASPYINHPIALVHVLCVEVKIVEPSILASAALHDTIEDTETSREELERAFGVRIARIVAEVTDNKSLPREERKRHQIKHAPRKSREGALVTLADKICNLRDIAANPPPEWSLERRQQYFDWAKAVVDGLPRVSELLLELFEIAHGKRP